METDGNPDIEKNYEAYLTGIDKFNSSISTLISDLYRKIDALNQQDLALEDKVNKMDNSKEIESRIAKINSDMSVLSNAVNSAISAFNSSIEKMNDAYNDSAVKINKLNDSFNFMHSNVEELSDNINKSIENFNGVAKAINLKDKDYSDNLKRIEESLSTLGRQYDVVMTNIKQTAGNLSAADNELQQKLDKLNETVYSSLPSINSFSDDINELKKYK
ncbi:MAG: hypothetical protein M1580_02180, partial [Candidatus Parvarchaeota archaeon]|nr:hypothetical protein [Candidatus Parvarchaeota archaeon]